MIVYSDPIWEWLIRPGHAEFVCKVLVAVFSGACMYLYGFFGGARFIARRIAERERRKSCDKYIGYCRMRRGKAKNPWERVFWSQRVADYVSLRDTGARRRHE